MAKNEVDILDLHEKMLSMFENMEISVTKKLRSDLARN